MPLIRKVVAYGRSSRGIILPKSWLKYFEDKNGCPIEACYIEVNRILKVSPVLQDPQNKQPKPEDATKEPKTAASKEDGQ